MTPKTTNSIRYLAVSAIIGLFSISALAQISLPDYSKWMFSASSMNAILNDKTMSLEFFRYLNRDDKEKHLFVNVLNNEKREPWIAFHVIIYADQTKRREFHLFEYKNKKWEYVKNFSDSQDLENDTADFLKDKYNLIWQ